MDDHYVIVMPHNHMWIITRRIDKHPTTIMARSKQGAESEYRKMYASGGSKGGGRPAKSKGTERSTKGKRMNESLSPYSDVSSSSTKSSRYSKGSGRSRTGSRSGRKKQRCYNIDENYLSKDGRGSDLFDQEDDSDDDHNDYRRKRGVADDMVEDEEDRVEDEEGGSGGELDVQEVEEEEDNLAQARTFSRYRAVEEKGVALERENEDLRSRIVELEHVAQGVRSKFSGKNHVRKKDTLTMTDRLNSSQMNAYLKKKLFPYVKFLPKRWMKYKKKERSLCFRLMALVTVPTLADRETYWREILCPMINEKWCAIRANIKEGVRIQYLGEY